MDEQCLCVLCDGVALHQVEVASGVVVGMCAAHHAVRQANMRQQQGDGTQRLIEA